MAKDRFPPEDSISISDPEIRESESLSATKCAMHLPGVLQTRQSENGEENYQDGYVTGYGAMLRLGSGSSSSSATALSLHLLEPCKRGWKMQHGYSCRTAQGSLLYAHYILPALDTVGKVTVLFSRRDFPEGREFSFCVCPV